MGRQDTFDVLGKMACQNGIHHMKGRMQNSAMEYRVTDGSTDLAWKSDVLTVELKSVLIENNPRPPGATSNTVILHTYGVEFYALHLLIAIGDAPRIRALSVPFQNGPQYYCDLVSMSAVCNENIVEANIDLATTSRFTAARCEYRDVCLCEFGRKIKY